MKPRPIWLWTDNEVVLRDAMRVVSQNGESSLHILAIHLIGRLFFSPKCVMGETMRVVPSLIQQVESRPLPCCLIGGWPDASEIFLRGTPSSSQSRTTRITRGFTSLSSYTGFTRNSSQHQTSGLRMNILADQGEWCIFKEAE